MYSPLITGDACAVKGHMKTVQHTGFALHKTLTYETGNLVGRMADDGLPEDPQQDSAARLAEPDTDPLTDSEGQHVVTAIAHPGTVAAPRPREWHRAVNSSCCFQTTAKNRHCKCSAGHIPHTHKAFEPASFVSGLASDSRLRTRLRF